MFAKLAKKTFLFISSSSKRAQLVCLDPAKKRLFLPYRNPVFFRVDRSSRRLAAYAP